MLQSQTLQLFGAGLPVVAYSGYESFGELVREGVNGRGFETPGELAVCLGRLLGKNVDELGVLRKGAEEESRRRWGDEWTKIMTPILRLNEAAGSRAAKRSGPNFPLFNM